MLQIRVRAPSGSRKERAKWLSAPRTATPTEDRKHAASVRYEVTKELETRFSYRLLESCLLRAAFYDDGSNESDFAKAAAAAASRHGAEAELAQRRVDPGVGLILDEPYDDSAWEPPQNDSAMQEMKKRMEIIAPEVLNGILKTAEEADARIDELCLEEEKAKRRSARASA